ncbi:MAG: hypothetical protein F6J94_14950 [Moorea sp. SIO1F2]|uniref:hypothetical protein n=1 Tax=Moorena sp. SIO1F2 TaxID=2607819 RepID=UPI0013BC929E|nr:hypothetical protein [Moorena sp. SIO1F2]NET83176.1 hypothetical protein [Moorena sp. SIO1F2]
MKKILLISFQVFIITQVLMFAIVIQPAMANQVLYNPSNHLELAQSNGKKNKSLDYIFFTINNDDNNSLSDQNKIQGIILELYKKMEFGFNECNVEWGRLQSGVSKKDMIKLATEDNANGFTYNAALKSGYILIGDYPYGCESPPNDWTLYLLLPKIGDTEWNATLFNMAERDINNAKGSIMNTYANIKKQGYQHPENRVRLIKSAQELSNEISSALNGLF